MRRGGGGRGGGGEGEGRGGPRSYCYSVDVFQRASGIKCGFYTQAPVRRQKYCLHCQPGLVWHTRAPLEVYVVLYNSLQVSSRACDVHTD